MTSFINLAKPKVIPLPDPVFTPNVIVTHTFREIIQARGKIVPLVAIENGDVSVSTYKQSYPHWQARSHFTFRKINPLGESVKPLQRQACRL